MRAWPAALFWSCLSVRAFAQTADAQAAALFDQGIAEMRNRNFDKACPALAESVRLDRRPGAIFTLGDCEAEWGKLASALTHYRDYLELAESLSGRERSAQNERINAARAAIAELTRAVPKLSLRLGSDAPADTSIELDGTVLGSASIGVELPIDPGEHAIVIRANGRSNRRMSIQLARGEQRSLEVEPGPPPEKIPAPTIVPAPSKPEPARREPAVSNAPSPWSYVALGVGVVGVGIGATTGLLAFSQKSKVDDNCRGTDCNSSGLDAADRGKRYALWSTISFAVGAAGLGTGLALLVTSSSEPKRASYTAAWSTRW